MTEKAWRTDFTASVPPISTPISSVSLISSSVAPRLRTSSTRWSTQSKQFWDTATATQLCAAADLLIAGHTHGGQYFPFNLLVRLFQPFVAGLHRLEQMWLYVSRGTGYWGPPLRLGAPGEITVNELVRAMQP